MDNRFGITDCNAIENLQIYKYTKKPGLIHGIGLDPFYVMYWSKQQMTLYKIINRFKNAYFTMDATGSIAKKLPMPDGTKSAHLFFVPMRNRSGIQTWYPSFSNDFHKTRWISFNIIFY